MFCGAGCGTLLVATRLDASLLSTNVVTGGHSRGKSDICQNKSRFSHHNRARHCCNSCGQGHDSDDGVCGGSFFMMSPASG